jgi:hypothetical protein
MEKELVKREKEHFSGRRNKCETPRGESTQMAGIWKTKNHSVKH